MKYLIDTDWVIECLCGETSKVGMLVRLADEDGLAISIVTYGEVYEAAYHSPKPQKHLKGFQDFLGGKEVLGIDKEVMERFAILRGQFKKEGKQISDPDLLIAATALQYDLTLVTNNLDPFRQIEGLKLYQN